MADGTTATGEIRRISKTERIAALDVVRGLAILAILVMNIPYMGGYGSFELWDPRLISWTATDKAVFSFVSLTLNGTQRGLLELLFGAGIMIMARDAIGRNGPVAVADLHYRRNLWLMALGVFQALVLFWPGDILLPYGIVAIFVFGFRNLSPRMKAILGALVILGTAVPGVLQYQERAAAQAAAPAIQARQARHLALSEDEQAKLKTWQAALDRVKTLSQSPEKQKAVAAERKARLGPLAGYARFTRDLWIKFNFDAENYFTFAEIFGTMLIGMALYEWGVIQGRRGALAYAAMALVGYGVGVSIRWVGLQELLRFDAAPKVQWFTWDIGRIFLTLGHVGLINLALKSRAGQVLLAPFQATGKTPLTTYLGASLICMVILFPGIGFGLWGRWGYAGLETIALVVMAGQLVFANLWLMVFETGPLEWFWKSLAYRKAQPFLKLGPAGAIAAAAE